MNTTTHVLTKPRLAVVDSLRGFALLGILIANIPFAPDTTEIYQARDWSIGSANISLVLDALFHLLIDKKFITIFGILFGFGFYIQMQKGLENGIHFKRYFLIRMVLLFLIGALHAYLLWFGDILRYYAICGMFLLFIYHWPKRKILLAALFFNVLLTASVFVMNGILGLPHYTYDIAIVNEYPVTKSWARFLEINTTLDPMVNFVDDSILTFVFSFGNILLGFWLGKVQFFEKPDKNWKNLKKPLIVAFVIGMGASYLFWLVSKGTLELTPALIWLPLVIVGGLVLLSISYVVAFVKLFCHTPFRCFFQSFGPVGKMALTNYLLQTVFYLVLFFHFSNGLKLFNRITHTETYLLAIVLFSFQMLFSWLWLKKFSQGPIEFIWKKLSYRFFISEKRHSQGLDSRNN
ncbi:DUF418 domain-containing protein [soil metagenome]